MGTGAARLKRTGRSAGALPESREGDSARILPVRDGPALRWYEIEPGKQIIPAEIPFSKDAVARKSRKPTVEKEVEPDSVSTTTTYACQVTQTSVDGVKRLSVIDERTDNLQQVSKRSSSSRGQAESQEAPTRIDTEATRRSSIMFKTPETHPVLPSPKPKPSEDKSGGQSRSQSLTSMLPMLSNLPTINPSAMVGSADSRFPVAAMPRARVQKSAPAFKGKALMPNGIFSTISLEQYVGKYLVLFFYPGDFTFVCPTEIIEFSERYEEFKNLHCEIVACSVDSEYCHKAWTGVPRSKGGLGKMNIPILADPTRQIAQAYDVLVEDDGVALRGLFIIDPKGIVRQITVNDLEVGRNVDEVKRLVEAFQYSDKHGSVCPQGWTAGKKTIKPDPQGALEFFETVPI
ncbi:peroxiredoxin 1-like isoform X2 [Sycon ciliatum]|uniref:peroxiredoxin 1-like isoform X2 n=1 Tax=Sycon ciliatum TaxID=27933 RepID=UPI0031F6809E